MGSRGVCPSRFLARGGRVDEDIPCGYHCKQVAHRERANLRESHLSGERCGRRCGDISGDARCAVCFIRVHCATQQPHMGANRLDQWVPAPGRPEGRKYRARLPELAFPRGRAWVASRPLGGPLARVAALALRLARRLQLDGESRHMAIACRGRSRHLPAHKSAAAEQRRSALHRQRSPWTESPRPSGFFLRLSR